ncbi:hypothetical protein AB751O23_DF_00040, partial [Chlamydiales bacterium SCGC AB-751-O23]
AILNTVAETLGGLKNQDALDFLILMSENQNLEIKLSAINSLSEMDNEGVLKAFEVMIAKSEGLAESKKEILSAIATVLTTRVSSREGERSKVIEILKKMFDDPLKEIKMIAIKALIDINTLSGNIYLMNSLEAEGKIKNSEVFAEMNEALETVRKPTKEEIVYFVYEDSRVTQEGFDLLKEEGLLPKMNDENKEKIEFILSMLKELSESNLEEERFKALENFLLLMKGDKQESLLFLNDEFPKFKDLIFNLNQ